MHSMDTPWKEWIPGVLNTSQICKLCRIGLITGSESLTKVIGESSIDLSLSDVAYRMKEGSVKPSRSGRYEHFLKEKKLAEKLSKDKDGVFILKNKETYVFKLREQLDNRLANANIYGQATAKSSIGRVDVLARLIVDGMDTYESFDPEGLQNAHGEMFIEITPITFSVKAKEGIRLSQLRLCYGPFKEIEIKSNLMFNTVLKGPGSNDGSLSVNLENTRIGGQQAASFCATTPNPDIAIPLWEEENDELKPNPWEFWKFVIRNENQHLKIEQNKFYLLRSKEIISVPSGVALYCKASDETIGEMRIHYAGFVHPLFGLRRKDKQLGTPLIFEVRGHQVDVSLSDEEKLAKLQFYRMSKDYSSEKSSCPYGSDKQYCKDYQYCPFDVEKKQQNSYEDQDLKLSAFFKEWPEKLLGRGNDGTVEPS